MKVLILQGSPNWDGSTAMLADEFARGARQAGHDACLAAPARGV